MFGFKKKTTKVTYPETFCYNPGTLTRVCSGAEGAVLQVLDKRLNAGHNTYKGRFVGDFNMRVELEEFKDVTLPEVFFAPKDDYGNPIR